MATFFSFVGLAKFLRNDAEPKKHCSPKQVKVHTNGRPSRARPVSKTDAIATKKEVQPPTSALTRSRPVATAKSKSPYEESRSVLQPDASSRRMNLGEPKIADDRKSLQEFDRRLAAGPDVPEDQPTPKDVETVREREANAVALFCHGLERDADATDVIIGLDVGSTATKMILRLPYSEDIGLPVPAPTWFRAEGHPYYWRTLLWKSKCGQFSIDPRTGATPIDRLKVDFLEFESEGRQAFKVAMVAWVVLMARQAIGWLRNERPRLFRDGSVVVDEVNLGMPFTTIDEAHPDQLQLADAVGRMLKTGEEVTEDAIALALESAELGEYDLVGLQPELAGALHGFLKSNQRRDGRYLLADIGGLTIDTVFFGYREADSTPITVFAKSVERFGSDVISKWCEEIGSAGRATKVLGNHLASVSKSAIQEKILVSADDRGKPFELETILIGGGRHSKPHKASIEWCENSMIRHSPPLDLRPRDLQPDRDDLDVQLPAGMSIGRLLVAMGLSFSRHDAPEIRPRSKLPDVERAPPRDVSNDYVGPEQC